MVAASRQSRRSPCRGDRVGGCGRVPRSAAGRSGGGRNAIRGTSRLKMWKSGERYPSLTFFFAAAADTVSPDRCTCSLHLGWWSRTTAVCKWKLLSLRRSRLGVEGYEIVHEPGRVVTYF
jgi:hypothetical protein